MTFHAITCTTDDCDPTCDHTQPGACPTCRHDWTTDTGSAMVGIHKCAGHTHRIYTCLGCRQATAIEPAFTEGCS